MYATGRMFGLEENSYVDERMDPVLATDAACRYLKKLYGIYNDWNLALAAYNAGPGNVNKAIRRSGNKLTYWEVRPFLPKETQGYVPNFIAAAYLLTYHAEHNIIPMEASVEYDQLDTMCLQKGVHFATIGKLLDMDEESIATLNPIYKRSYVPKGVTKEYCITLPLDKIGKLVSLEDSLYNLEYQIYVSNTETETSETPSVETDTNVTTTNAYEYHKVKAGETLSSIAGRYSMTLHDIQRVNGLTSTKIYVGQRLKVIVGSSTTVVPPVNNTPPPAATKQYYTVRSGDTFGKIAQSHRLSISQLKSLNPRINIDRITVGQKIRVK
jgi:membrane-bound lytic murein transglycosylase D